MDNIVYSTREVIYKDFILNDEDTQKVLERAKELEEECPNWGGKSFYIENAISELLDEELIEGGLMEQDNSGEEVVSVCVKKEDGGRYPIE